MVDTPRRNMTGVTTRVTAARRAGRRPGAGDGAYGTAYNCCLLRAWTFATSRFRRRTVRGNGVPWRHLPMAGIASSDAWLQNPTAYVLLRVCDTAPFERVGTRNMLRTRSNLRQDTLCRCVRSGHEPTACRDGGAGRAARHAPRGTLLQAMPALPHHTKRQ